MRAMNCEDGRWVRDEVLTSRAPQIALASGQRPGAVEHPQAQRRCCPRVRQGPRLIAPGASLAHVAVLVLEPGKPDRLVVI